MVPNHATDQLTTSPFIYAGEHVMGVHYDYEEFKAEAWYIEGLHPRECVKNRRIIIGNDVWLGHNTIITNGANIGNGVISGAGAIITKDVPDYAIVVGVPAYIIRYRYEPEEIAALNRIQWWNWSDEEIRARYDDLYLPIRQFIAKYDQK